MTTIDQDAIKAFADAEEFIRRLNDLEITIEPRAADIYYGEAGMFKKKKSLADHVASAVGQYQTLRDNPFADMGEYSELAKQDTWNKNSFIWRLSAAREIKIWVAKAHSHNVIKESPSVTGKLRVCRERCNELESENENLRQLNLKLINDFKGLEGRYMEAKLQNISNRDGSNTSKVERDDDKDE